MKNVSLNFDYRSYQEKIRELDKLWFENSICDSDSPYWLNRELEPCPFEGNLLEAKVILLLANPHLNKNSLFLDHNPNDTEGWGLWGLNDGKGYSVTSWWRARLKSFVKDQYDNDSWRQLSLKVAAIQVIPWASKSFPPYKLPSIELMLNTVKLLAEHDKDKVFIICRQRNIWNRALNEASNTKYFLRNVRCSYITRNNLNNHNNVNCSDYEWEQIMELLESS